MTANDTLQVDYQLPAGCAHLPFLKVGDGAATIRSKWQAQGQCGRANGDVLERLAPSCPRLRFQVPATSDKVTGYPGSFPMGQAVYAHMSNYAVDSQCGPVSYAFEAPGGVETASAAFEREAASDADAPALLFFTRSARGRKDLDYFDPALSAAAVTQIRVVADGTATFLRAAMPNALFKRPIIATALPLGPGGPHIEGSAGDILLLSLFNWPEIPAPQHQRQMNKLVAHEMSHRFQLRDAVDVYPNSRLIHEGGAGFLRWTVSLSQGWLTSQEAAAELDDALAACMLGTENLSWTELSPRDVSSRRLEYACGLPAYVYALAARQGEGTAYSRLDDFYQQLRRGATPDFAQAMECGSSPCAARVLSRLFDASAPMRKQWSGVLDQLGLAESSEPSQSQVDAMMTQALTHLVVEDCAGKRSMTPTPQSILIDTLPACRSFRADVEVVRVEGFPVFGAKSALPAIVEACSTRHVVELGLNNESTMEVACTTPYQVMTRFYAADMEKLTRALTRK